MQRRELCAKAIQITEVRLRGGVRDTCFTCHRAHAERDHAVSAQHDFSCGEQRCAQIAVVIRPFRAAFGTSPSIDFLPDWVSAANSR